jgi:hypothetical protein
MDFDICDVCSEVYDKVWKYCPSCGQTPSVELFLDQDFQTLVGPVVPGSGKVGGSEGQFEGAG